MTIERADPIPAGKYWINVKMPGMDGGKQFRAWMQWLVDTNGPAAEWDQSADRAVQVTHTEDGPPDGMGFMIFTITRPTKRWPTESGLGLPTIAGPNIQSAEDTVSRPDPEPDATAPGGALEQVLGGLKVIGFGLAAVYLIGKYIERK